MLSNSETENLWHVQNWKQAKSELDTAKNYELQQRTIIRDQLFPDARKGTQRFTFPAQQGAVKLVFGYTYTLGDKDAVKPDQTKISVYDQVVSLEEKIRKLGPKAEVLVERLIRWKPELVEKEYLLLGDTDLGGQIKGLIDEILTVKEASPQIAFEPFED